MLKAALAIGLGFKLAMHIRSLLSGCTQPLTPCGFHWLPCGLWARILPGQNRQLGRWRPGWRYREGPVSYRIAVGPQQGRKAFMIRTIRPLDRPDPGLERAAKANGFSLHTGVSCEGRQKDKRERLCRYIARPPVAIPRLSLSSIGKVVYTLKTGTTQVAFEPVDFIARLAALVPKPRVNLTRYHDVLAPNHRWRGEVIPAKRGKAPKMSARAEVKTPIERHAATNWAQRLKRVFNIDIEACGRCGGSLKVIACIEDQDIIDMILAHLREKEQNAPARPLLAPNHRWRREVTPPNVVPKSLIMRGAKISFQKRLCESSPLGNQSRASTILIVDWS